MPNLDWVREVKVLDTGFGYAPQFIEEHTTQLNLHLKDGWRLIEVVNDTKISLELDRQAVTHSYYIIGR